MKTQQMLVAIGKVCQLLEDIKPKIGAYDQSAILKSAAVILENKAQAEVMAKSMAHAIQQALASGDKS